MITYKICDTILTVPEGASLALKHRLYISGWSLSGELIKFREAPLGCLLILAMEGEVPVGVLTLSNKFESQIFVKKSKRNSGIGKSLVKELRSYEPDLSELYVDRGILGSNLFWRKMIPERY